jgi:hypothetical protein
MDELLRDAQTQVEGEEIVILGICRDVSRVLKGDVTKLSNSFSDFKKVHFRLVESDSNDATLDVLDELSREIPNFSYKTLGKLQKSIPERVQRITHCRNACLDLLDSDVGLNDCTYVVVSDLDGMNNELTRENVLSCWFRKDWDACMANQSAPYYDIYALRHPIWSPNDCWHYEGELRARGFNPVSAREIAVYSRQVTIPIQSIWIPVESAFGGLAIYKRAAMKNFRYSATLANGDHVCEHVTLHAQMRAQGAKLFINPKLVNCSWNTHNSSMKIPKIIKRKIKLVFYLLFPRLRQKFFQ